MRPRVVLATVATLLQAILVGLMFAATIGKIIEFGFLEYVQHFTNWSWSLQTAFYFFTLPSYLIVALEVDDWKLHWQARFIAITFLPLWGIVSTVLLLVILMLLVGSDMLDSLIMVVPISVIVLGNEVFHFFTVLLLATWAVANQRMLYYALNQLFSHRKVHQTRKIYWALILYETIIGSSIPLLFYVSIFDPHVVYQTEISFFLGTLAAFAALALATSPIYLFIHMFYMGSAPLEVGWLHESEFEARGERIVMQYAKFNFQ